MRLMTDPDDAWPSVGSPRRPELRAAAETSGIGSVVLGALHPVTWLRRAIGGTAQTQGGAASLDAQSLIPALSSIRSSAEILRDTPDIGAADRRRFAEIVLAEEARLEALVKEVVAGSSPAR